MGGLFAPVLELIEGLAAADALIVGFEDLHWADVATWDLFEFLARNLVDEHVVLVGTYRANETSIHADQRRRLAELSRLPTAHRIHLGGLDRDDIMARVTALIGNPAPFDLVDQVLLRGEGNPFFTEELVAAALGGRSDSGGVVRPDRRGHRRFGRRDPSRAYRDRSGGPRTPTTSCSRVSPLLDGDALETAVRAGIDAQILANGSWDGHVPIPACAGSAKSSTTIFCRPSVPAFTVA